MTKKIPCFAVFHSTSFYWDDKKKRTVNDDPRAYYVNPACVSYFTPRTDENGAPTAETEIALINGTRLTVREGLDAVGEELLRVHRLRS